MLENVGGILQLALRLGAAVLAMYWGLHFVRLPLAASVGIGQIVFYVSFVVVPVHLAKLLMLDELNSRFSGLDKVVVQLHCLQSQVWAGQASVEICEVLRNQDVEKASRICQLQRLIRSRDRQFADLFFHDMIPVLMVVAGTVIFSIVSQKVPAEELKHLGLNPQSPVISFAQGLIGIVPVVWALGKLYGEINFIRSRVFDMLE